MNMNWVRELLDLYEGNRQLVGRNKTGRFGEEVILLPPFHTTVKAQITVHISPKGDFIRADKESKTGVSTVIPVTEDSASRTVNIAPHPLCDNLSYIAGNFKDYALNPKSKPEKKHQAYLEGLKAWAQSPQSHEKVRAVYNYVLREHTIEDLLSSPGVLPVDENGKIDDQFIRFSIEGDMDDRSSLRKCPPECWKDPTLWDAYIDYVKSKLGDPELSYLTGEDSPISYLQPRIGMAKLISSNDGDGFTYRGRFATKEEAFAIGYEESLRLHNALRWIIDRQGKSYGDLTVVVWESKLEPLPAFDAGADEICGEDIDFFMGDEENGAPVKEDNGPEQTQAARFLSAIDGYGKKLDYDSNTMLLALNIPTKGRISIMESSSLPTSVYLDNVKRWHADCGLIHTREKDNRRYYGMVSLKGIADLLYKNDSTSNKDSKDFKKLLPTVCNRLRPCIIYGRPLPIDMVNLAVRKASSPQSYKHESKWEQMLSLASSMVKKKRIEQGEKWTMALNRDSKNRSYLFGRLLAIADRIEYRSYSEGARQTNAKRYMNMFSQRPSRTWQIIAERVEPYKQKLSISTVLYCDHLIEEICQNFAENDFLDDSPLDGLYLLGYYHQSYELRNKNETKESEENENE